LGAEAVVIGGSLSTNAGSTWTWQVAHEQHPPHKASSSSKPLSWIASITERPSIVSTVRSSPLRVTTVSLGICAFVSCGIGRRGC
jgi:hypothetical protein